MGVMSVLGLFPKASGWIRTFLAYCDSRHSLKRDRVQVRVFLDLHGLFWLLDEGACGDAP